MSSDGGGARCRARERALQALYQSDQSASEGGSDAFETYWQHFGEDDAPVRTMAEDLVRGVQNHRGQIDQLIEASSKNWRIDRMSRVDRNILRLATCELLLSAEVPRSVVLNEAIEIAKRFGAEGSAAFVNGVLDRIADDIGR